MLQASRVASPSRRVVHQTALARRPSCWLPALRLFDGFGGSGGGGLRRFVGAAVGDDEARAAVGFVAPLLFEFLRELGERRLLASGDELLFDRGLHLRKRFLATGRDTQDLKDVVAEWRLYGTAEHTLGGREDRFVERLLLLAFDDFLEQPAVGLAGGVDGDALGDTGEALARFDFLLGFAGGGFGLGEDDLDVALFRRAVLRLVFVVVLADLRRRDFALFLDDLLLDFLREHVELDAQQQIRDRLARGGKEFFEFGALGELLGLYFREFLLDFLVGQLDAQRGCFADYPLGGDQEAEHLGLQGFVLHLAL